MTVCTKCLVDKADSEFYARSSRPKGITSRCKLCCNAAMHVTWSKNKEKYAETGKRWRAANPDLRKQHGIENKEKRKLSRAAHEARNPGAQAAKSRRFRENNPDSRAATSKKWKLANPDKLRAIYRAWQQANPDRVRASSSNRRAAHKLAIPAWEQDAKARELQWRKQNPGMTLDHIVPITPPLAITLGAKPANWQQRRKFVGPLIPLVYGFHTEANWAPLAFHENARKGNRDWPDSPWS
jgi:hypothetical protein